MLYLCLCVWGHVALRCDFDLFCVLHLIPVGSSSRQQFNELTL